MPRRRSQTRITAVLPRELLQRSLEFVPFAEVAADVKRVSREFRGAARHALTHGRWKPIKLFAQNGLNMINEERVSEASREIFRAAWALEPAEVFFELAHWDSGRRFTAPRAAQFLKIVEPTIEGLPRIVAACEYAQGAFDGDMKPVTRVGSWAASLDHQVSLGYPDGYGDYRSPVLDREAEDRLFGLGLESWTDPKLAAAFARDVLGYNAYYECGFWDVWNLDSDSSGDRIYRAMHEGWVQDWRDRGKADAFVEEGFRLQDEAEQEMEAEFQEQWEEEHGWKYCPHGDKLWDCPDCRDDWNEGHFGDDDDEDDEED